MDLDEYLRHQLQNVIILVGLAHVRALVKALLAHDVTIGIGWPGSAQF